MKESGLISDIIVKDPFTWENKIFLTTDIDWACDEVIEFCDNLFNKFGCKVTWFVTHDTPITEKLRKNKNYELGIHPNFNPLLMNGSYEKGVNAKEIISKTMQLVPDAKAIRSHSITQSSILMSLYKEFGLKYDLNTFILLDEDLHCKPFDYYFETIKLPYIWQDDTYLDCNLDKDHCLNILKKAKGLVIVNFHPIHLFLNSENMTRYMNCRPFYTDYQKLVKEVNKNQYGVRNFFEELLSIL